MKEQYRCVIDASGNYKTFVLLDKAGRPQYYQLAAGEQLVDTSPPVTRPHAGGEGLIKPRWNDEAWTEAATATEARQWEQEHPAPPQPRPTQEQMQLAALALRQAQQDTIIAQLQLAQAQATGGGEVDA